MRGRAPRPAARLHASSAASQSNARGAARSVRPRARARARRLGAVPAARPRGPGACATASRRFALPGSCRRRASGLLADQDLRGAGPRAPTRASGALARPHAQATAPMGLRCGRTRMRVAASPLPATAPRWQRAAAAGRSPAPPAGGAHGARACAPGAGVSIASKPASWGSATAPATVGLPRRGAPVPTPASASAGRGQHQRERSPPHAVDAPAARKFADAGGVGAAARGAATASASAAKPSVPQHGRARLREGPPWAQPDRPHRVPQLRAQAAPRRWCAPAPRPPPQTPPPPRPSPWRAPSSRARSSPAARELAAAGGAGVAAHDAPTASASAA